jgi:transposase
MNRGDLTNEQWEKLQPFLPAERPHTGRPAQDHRTIVNGILWVLRTGAPWRDMPERYGKWSTIYSRFRRWKQAGIWDKLFSEIQSLAEQRNEVDWEIHFVDGSIVRVHQHAAGQKKAPR